MIYTYQDVWVKVYDEVDYPHAEHEGDAAKDLKAFLSPIQLELHEKYYENYVFKNDPKSFNKFVLATETGVVDIEPGEVFKIPTGLCMTIPTAYPNYCFILSRSGLSNKNIVVSNSPGLIDSSYRYESTEKVNEVIVLLANRSQEQFTVKNRDRIAQALFPFEVLDEPGKAKKRSGGLGHSGM